MSLTTSALDVAGESPDADRWRTVGWLLLGVLAYFLLGLLGRATIVEGEVLSLVWPAAGASMLMFGLTSPRWWWLVSALVALATVGLNLLTGATGTQVVIFVVSNVLQALCAVMVLRVLSPQLRGAGGALPLEERKDFWSIVIASVVGSLLGAISGSLGRGLLLDSWSWIDFFVWWGRNAVGCVVIVTTGLLALATWRRLRGRAIDADVRAAVAARGVETFLLIAFTAALYLVVFVTYTTLPVAFPLLVPTVWVGLRYSPLSVAVHSLGVCTLVVLFTMAGRGSFAMIDSWHEQVLIAQLFIALVFCLGTLLALGRAERQALTRTLSAARAESEGQALLMTTVIDSMHDGVSVIDEHGQVRKRNPAGAEMVRSSPDVLNHLRDSGFTMTTPDGSEIPAQDYPWNRALAGDNVVEEDMVLVFDDGSPSRTLAVSARRLPSLDPEAPRQAVVIYHDVTNDRAQRSALESFAGVVAHDLLGPLGVIDGWTEMLAQDLETEQTLSRAEAGPKLERIRSATDGMRQLVRDMLESATSRDQELRSTEVDLDAVARSVAEQRSVVAGGQPPRITVAPLPPVYADAAQVRQLLDNLVSNAVKYVVPGEVANVTVTGRPVGDFVEVTVADEGIGIPPSQRDEIFEVFQRAHAAQDYDGHGIGLSVCKRIVERHGGRIYARPPLGERGARIVFSLPAVAAG
jgi:signal transduction histidine kinase/integral membrane sensor domain MASE1